MLINFAKKPLCLAPMAGFSDLPFRKLVKKFGADFTISEMISANALVFESQKSLKMLEKSENEIPFIVQIAGVDKEVIKKAVQILNQFDFINGIDFNCGCPVNKVVKQGAGSALLNDLNLLKELVSIIKENNKLGTTSVKFRLGFDEKVPESIAKACEAGGADFVALHGRTRKQLYSGSADYNAICKAKESIKIPLIANGDINAQNANFVLEKTKADGLMIGRASVGNPWIFTEIKTGEKITPKLKKEMIIFHFHAMLEHYAKQGISIFRKHLHEYSKGYAEASNFRNKINQINDETKMLAKIEEFF